MTTALDTQSIDRVARQLKAVADERRLQIIALLRNGDRCVCELTDSLDAGQSLLSFHLKTLKEAGLVTDRREGRWVHYSLVPEAFELLESFLRDVRTPEGPGAVRSARSCD
jgi:ArsR family transcriptional regulator